MTAAPAGASTRAWVDIAKGAAIYLVVFYHTTLFFEPEGIAGLPGRLKQLLEAFPMPAFFLISGLFAARVGSWTLAQLWKRRLLPLLWLYVVWSIIRFGFYLLFPETTRDLDGLAAGDIRSLLLILVWPTSSYWFLYALFWFTFGVWALRRLPVWVQVSGTLLLSGAVTSNLINFQNVGWNRTAALFVFFLVGALFHDQIIAGVRRARVGWLIGLVALYLGTIALVMFIPGARSIPLAITAAQAFAVAAAFVAASYLAYVKPVAWVLRTVGAWSLQIYLLHLFFIAALATVLGMWLPDMGGVTGAAVTVAASVVVTVLSILLSKLTTKAKFLYVPPRRLLGIRTTRKQPA